MQGKRIVAPQLLQHVPVKARLADEVFGMDFEPVELGPLLKKLPIVRRPQANANGAVRELTGASFDAHDGNALTLLTSPALALA